MTHPRTDDPYGTSERNMGSGKMYVSPGEHAEKVRKREYKKGRAGSGGGYVELRAASAFSFLDGASLPEDLLDRAAALGLACPGVDEVLSGAAAGRSGS